MKAPDSPETPRPGEPIRERWTARRADGSVESEAGGLLRAAAVDEPLSDARLGAVRARLSERPRRVHRSFAWQLAFGLAVTLGGATLVVAATTVTRWIQTRVRAPQVAPAPTAVRAPHHHRGPGAAPAPQTVAAPQPVAPVPPTVAPPASPAPAAKLALNDPHVARRVAAPAAPRAVEVAPPTLAPVAPPAPPRAPYVPPPSETPPLPPPSTALAQESALLARALRVLRQEGDAPAALKLFDEHALRFPAGALALEERVGRAEALLQLGRRAEALALLDGMELPSKGRRRDMLVTRGELRAGANRCAEALIDFGLALTSETGLDAAAERALYGRASCRARLGDADGARADLQTYVERFPNGRFASDARETLRR